MTSGSVAGGPTPARSRRETQYLAAVLAVNGADVPYYRLLDIFLLFLLAPCRRVSEGEVHNLELEPVSFYAYGLLAVWTDHVCHGVDRHFIYLYVLNECCSVPVFMCRTNLQIFKSYMTPRAAGTPWIPLIGSRRCMMPASPSSFRCPPGGRYRRRKAYPQRDSQNYRIPGNRRCRGIPRRS